ncbi:MAG: hypothetical protein EBZ13_10715 [Planctomycetia bacterium]|nr:hypothetical protein [Planctomycetia bacterium]
MRMIDHDSRQDCRVIPFVKPTTSEDKSVASTIAAVIAVTILHQDGESPEDRLMEIIEASGEAEVLDIIDAIEEFEAGDPISRRHHPVNDNQFLGVV